ncbi:MAG TPA: DUF6220 domain-containing protein [Solirubrobacterales bacterium]|nr:MAG: hypothetical protein E6F97_09315 [Actinomycetota bacterium]HMC49423.1 DUF6220 domain-containing protein [Solirubrobacterales bacterium]
MIVQIGAAGYGAFYAADKADPGPVTHHAFDHGWSFHDGFGYIVFYAAIVSFALAIIGRFPRKRVLEITGLPLLIAAQIGLAAGGESVPAIGVLHPVVAFIILGFAGRLAFEAGWGPRRRG